MLKISLFFFIISVLAYKTNGSQGNYNGYNRYNYRPRNDDYRRTSQQYDDNRYTGSYRSQKTGNTNDPVDCSDGGFFQKPNPESCNSFYKCDNGRPVLFPCPGGTEYSPSLHVCVEKHRSDCVSKSKIDPYNPPKGQYEQRPRPDNQNTSGGHTRPTTPTQNPIPSRNDDNYDPFDNITFLDD